jgi:hypothetical protein
MKQNSRDIIEENKKYKFTAVYKDRTHAEFLYFIREYNEVKEIAYVDEFTIIPEGIPEEYWKLEE